MDNILGYFLGQKENVGDNILLSIVALERSLLTGVTQQDITQNSCYRKKFGEGMLTFQATFDISVTYRKELATISYFLLQRLI